MPLVIPEDVGTTRRGHLSARCRLQAWERTNGKCVVCGDRIDGVRERWIVEHPKQYNPFTGVTDWCSGACLAITSDTFRVIGGFDESIFMYCEDIDLSWRAKSAGFECYTCSSALFFHKVQEKNRLP